jgi:hypothetical protein
MTATHKHSTCPMCPGPSQLLTRGGHDPACPAAQTWPVTGTSRKENQ